MCTGGGLCAYYFDHIVHIRLAPDCRLVNTNRFEVSKDAARRGPAHMAVDTAAPLVRSVPKASKMMPEERGKQKAPEIYQYKVLEPQGSGQHAISHPFRILTTSQPFHNVCITTRGCKVPHHCPQVPRCHYDWTGSRGEANGILTWPTSYYVGRVDLTRVLRPRCQPGAHLFPSYSQRRHYLRSYALPPRSHAPDI